jgi:NAD(P)-dependent dehydrogenase (short-subunit alcohol dehydrogenase family)
LKDADMSAQRSVLVTGGASGIGKAVAIGLGRAGYAVTVVDRDIEAGAAVVAELIAGGARAHFVQADISDEDSVRSAVDSAVSAYGRLDAAINSAGVAQAGKSLHELELSEWDQCNDINLRGMFLCMKHEIRAMLASGNGGAVVAISSAAAVKGLIDSAAYCASKAGVTGLVRGAAIDYAQQGIRINALLPGATETPLAARSSASNPRLAGSLTVPVGRMAQPEEIAAAAIWLASEQASYITGACLSADGGLAIA